MSQPGREFRLEWKTAVNEFTVRVSIYETDFLIPDGDIPEIIDLKPSANPLIFSTIDNDRNRYNPIKAKQAVISFKSGQYDINTFFDAPDDRWLVIITLPDTAVTLFKGYLVLNDMQQPFLPDPVEVVLTATDKLGTLKDVELSNTIGLDVLTGKILISIYLAHCLRSTGLEENINVQYNIREIDSNDFHLFWKNYIDTLTFEDEVGTLEDCYTVLTKILNMSGFVTQYKGEWFIKRIDEFDNAVPDYVAVFDTEGNFVSISNGVTYTQNIGALSSMKWANANQIVASDRPHKFAKLTYNYELPKELPCNTDLQNGDAKAVLTYTQSGISFGQFDPQEIILTVATFPTVLASGEEITVTGTALNDGTYTVEEYTVAGPTRIIRITAASLTNETTTATITYGLHRYDLDCWTLYEDRPLVPSTSSTAFIKRNNNIYGTEVERFAVIDVASTATEQILVSGAIEVQVQDRFDFSFSIKNNGQVETTGTDFDISYAQIHLHAHDGTYYTLDGGDSFFGRIPEWVACTSSFDTNQQYFNILFDGIDDDTKWKQGGFQNGDCPAIPKDGYIYIVFVHQYKVTEFQLHISSVDFTLIPYINGSYDKFTGHHNKVSRDFSGSVVDETIYLDSMPHPVYKGMIFKFDAILGRVVKTTQFYDHSKSPLLVPPTGPALFSSFDKMVSFDVWNQFKNGPRILEGDVLGLDDTNPPDVVHQYVFTNTDPNLLPRSYMCVSFEQNWKTEIWKGVFLETYNASVGRVYDDTAELKYLSNG